MGVVLTKFVVMCHRSNRKKRQQQKKALYVLTPETLFAYSVNIFFKCIICLFEVFPQSYLILQLSISTSIWGMTFGVTPHMLKTHVPNTDSSALLQSF